MLTDAFMDEHNLSRTQHEIDNDVFKEQLALHRWRVVCVNHKEVRALPEARRGQKAGDVK